jgi:hypothetical protein
MIFFLEDKTGLRIFKRQLRFFTTLLIPIIMIDNSTKDTIDFMLKQFKPERYAYLGVTIASFILLLTCVILFMTQNPMSGENVGYIAGMVGSGGAIAYTASQLLRMWRDCMSLFTKETNKKDSNE